jgi:beta-phosphoglucomutase
MKKIFENIEAIIFDFDGTIADTLKLHDAAFKEALNAYPFEFNYYEYLGLSTHDTLKKIFEQNNHTLSDEVLTTLTIKKRSLANQLYGTIDFMPGASDFIRHAEERGFSLFIGSSGSTLNITAGVTTLKIKNYFKGIYTASDINRSKPNPEIFQHILKTHQLNPVTTLVLEDAEAGVAAADAAGIDVISVDTTLQLSRHYPHFAGHFNFTQLSALIHE